MTSNNLKEEYYIWLCEMICKTNSKRLKYSKLLECLDSIQFNYILDRDGNRAEDGMDLRYRFGYEKHIEQSAVASILDGRPCSMLEMMVALSLKCEENIMCNVDIGDRTSYWFWEMVKSLGLYSMTDRFFDEGECSKIIDCFIERKYSPSGKGGLFTIPNSSEDMRNIEVWYQMQRYLNYIVTHEVFV